MDDDSQKNRRKLVWLVVGLAVFMIVAIAILALGRSNKEGDLSGSLNYPQTADAFVNALVEANGEGSFSLMTGRLQSEVDGVIAWSDAVQSRFGKGGERARFEGSERLQGSSDPGGEVIRYAYSIKFQNGVIIDIAIDVREENGSPRVDRYTAPPAPQP